MAAENNGSITFTRVLVTPELARQWLALNFDRNRPLRRKHIKSMALDMKKGSFVETHQPIAFDEHGKLVDGQHRLSAVIESGVSVWMVVARGVLKQNTVAIDVGSRRTISDNLKVAYNYDTNTSFIATTRALMKYGANINIDELTVEETRAFLEKHYEALEWSHRNLGNRRCGPSVVAGAVAAAWYTADREELVRFCRVLCTGVTNRPEDMTVIKLREWILTHPGKCSAKQKDAPMLWDWTLAAIRAFLDGVLLKGRADRKAYFPLEAEEEVSHGRKSSR